MSNKGRALAVRVGKRNASKRARQQGDKAARDAVHAMNAEAAEAAAEAVKGYPDSDADSDIGPEEFEDEAE